MNETAHLHGEINPLFGYVGHLLVILAFVAALLAAGGYFISVQSKDANEKLKWKNLARYTFIIHAACVTGIVATMFVMIFNHHFEYHYVWAHSSLDLQAKYILSCFWEGQEGSFLLWSFWHMALGIIMLIIAKNWEAPVLSVVCLMQAFLLSFLLGIYIVGETKVGVSPFLLLEDALTQDPVFLFDDYMRFISDGTGLNALLQNYWMVIHPPVLFLGFALLTIPFAFAISGLWTKQYTEWIKPALPFALFGAMVLGTGILMGGAWAYEALSFGGFWAWDPVENASLIPWLIMLAGMHTMIVSKATGHALRSTFILILLAFLFVLYASFLTRSGILGDTSVHAFVEEGLTAHLVIFLFAFLIISAIALIQNWKFLPTKEKEEATSSREFWMFVGSLVLLFASIHIVVFTSIPVFNAIFGTEFSTVANPVQYYTSVQIWVAVVIAVLTAFGQFLKFKQTDYKKFLREILLPVVIALAFTIFSLIILNNQWHITSGMGNFSFLSTNALLLLTASFTVAANIQYFIKVLKGRFRVSGGAVAHVGFGLLLIGILISNAGQKVISENTEAIQLFKDLDNKMKRENILLYRNVPQPMGDYIVTYLGDSSVNRETTYTIQFEKVDAKSGNISKTFYVYPYLLLDKKSQQLTPNPDTKHFLSHDVFTHISSIPSDEAKKIAPEISQDTITVGDTIFFSSGFMVLEDFKRYPVSMDTLTAGAQFKVFTGDKTEIAEPKIHIITAQDDPDLISEPVKLKNAELELKIANILIEKNEFVISRTERSVQSDWIIMKAIIFPMINMVWLGMIIMAIGFLISAVRRYSQAGF
jgi:cytochrome c-type biogenesis protein CcmF